jgi:hypothetical protein
VWNWVYDRLHVSGSVIVALFAVIVTVIGWTVNQKAQQRLFLHQVTNAARNELVEAVRKYQAAVSDLSGIDRGHS